MAKKLINKDPFSNGTEHDMFEAYNCNQCIKSSELKKDQISYSNCDKDGMPKCSIQRDIVKRMCSKEPIKEETVNICNEFSLYGVLCPYMQTEYPKHKHKTKTDKSQMTLF